MQKNALLLALLACFSSVQAAQECGTSAVNICTNTVYSSGIDYYGYSTTSVTLSNPAMNVQTNGVHVGPGRFAAGVASSTLAATDFNLVSTTAPGFNGYGLLSSNTGPATVTATNGEVKTVGGLDGGGNSAIAIVAEVLRPSTGNALAQVNGTVITTTGLNAFGILAVTGNGSTGVATGGSRIEASGITLSTAGANAAGLLAAGLNGNTGPVDIVFTSGTVVTQGGNSAAVGAVTQGGAVSIDIQAAAQATANGVGGSDGVVVVGPASADVTVNNAGKIKSAQADGINISAALHGGVITSSGDISGATAAVRGSPAADTFTASGGAIDGVTLMGDGNDVVTLTGSVNVSAAPQFDGGAGADTLNIDGISLSGFTAAANNPALGSNLTLWETVDVKNAGTLKLTGNLFDAANTGVLKLSDAASALDLQNAATSTSTVNGNFDSTGVLKIDTVVGDSSSASDVLHITGNTSSITVIQINNLGGLGALTTGNGILVVQVDGNSGGTFALPGGSLVVGQYAYTLQKVGNNWYLQSTMVGSVTVSKQVIVPAGASAFSGNIPFTLNCTAPSFSQAGTIVVSANQGTSSPITVAVGSACSVTEGTLPAAPAGMQWATPVYVQPGAIVGGQVATAVITNTLQRNVGSVTVRKQVTMPAGASAFSGNIPFTLDCTNPNFSQAGTIAVSGNQGISDPITVAVGSTCSVTEGALPAAPAGMEWASPAYMQPGAIVEGQVATSVITNTLKNSAIVDSTPAPVPALNQWALALLSMVFAGLAAVGLRRSRMH
ncbi:IPTL-CTERM sorting domain-containing protein [Comamonas odontotermitis]|uniref:IPTL-CTERM sorting domain-containing protein n=1 Tax=Comamonas odontotermitis TaxID=379895 RepID=UPI001CC7F100|nr:IPTL-CTERM sorting domain-containing protein [Comamonas odontotermitis]UBB15288.1 IPTL-CTERM sorting domain-containing protein [Comamonas odontotermitis]